MRSEVSLGLDVLRTCMLALSFITTGLAFIPFWAGRVGSENTAPVRHWSLGRARILVIGLSQFFAQVSGSTRLPMSVSFLLLAIGAVLLGIAVGSYIFARRTERWLERRAQTQTSP